MNPKENSNAFDDVNEYSSYYKSLLSKRLAPPLNLSFEYIEPFLDDIFPLLMDDLEKDFTQKDRNKTEFGFNDFLFNRMNSIMSVRPNFSQLDELTDILLFNKGLNKGDIGRNMVVLIRNPNCNSYLKNKILDALHDEDINFKSNLFIASLYLYDNDVVDELIKLFYSSLLKEKEKEELKIHFNFLAKRGDLSQSQKESLKVIIGN